MWFKKNNEVLEIRDCKTGFFPFMLAASARIRVETIYTMLLKTPNPFKNLLTTNYYKEEHAKLKKKLIEAEEKVKQLKESIASSQQ